MRIALILTVAVALSACVHSKHRASEAKAFVDAQAKAIAERPPLFELKAQPGQSIVLQGVESLTVNDPREQRVEALPVSRSPLVDVFNNALNVGAKVYGGKVAADAAVDILDVVTSRAGDHSITTITNTDIDRSDHSTSVGGNFGDTDQSTTFGDSALVGNDNVVGDANGDGERVGGDYNSGDAAGPGDRITIGGDANTGDQSGNSGRITSPGPIDNSDNSSVDNPSDGDG